MQFLCQLKRFATFTQDRYCAPRKDWLSAEMHDFFDKTDAPDESKFAPL
jgi:hypothetical protein